MLEPPTHTKADKESVLEPPARKASQGAPNRFVNFHNLKSTIESELGPCKHCKNKKRSLVQTQNVSFATTFQIHCQPCNAVKEQKRLELLYLDSRINKTVPVNKKERDEYRKMTVTRNNKKRHYDNVILPRRESKMIRPIRNKKSAKENEYSTLKKGSMQYLIMRSISAPY